MTTKRIGPYSQDSIAWVRAQGMKIKGAVTVRHIYPRAYCIAKPSPLCAVFVTPWMDAERQVRLPAYSASHIVHAGVFNVSAGDWCALAYVVTEGIQQMHAFQLPTPKGRRT